jgi:hypothetical protein
MEAFRYVVTCLAQLILSVVPFAGNAADFPVTYSAVSRVGLRPNHRATHMPFQRRKLIRGRNVGLVGDGQTDNTDALRELFSRPGQSVLIEAGDYRTGRFFIPADTMLTLAVGVTIRDTGHLGPNDPLVQIVGDHVKIIGKGARIVENRADYHADEGRHGVAIVKVSDVSIDGLEVTGAGGDGFYIGGPENKPASNVSLINCVARNNRRQGLSITNARYVDVLNSRFSGSVGTPPAFGVDLEPNWKSDYLDGILLYRIRTAHNDGGGVLIYVNQLDRQSARLDIEIVDHQSDDETPFVASTAVHSVTGDVRYVRVR